MPFEDLQTVPDAKTLLDKAFSRAARTGRAKQGVEAQQAMLDVATHILTDNLEHIERTWPNLDELDPFHRDIVDALVGVHALRSHLESIGWAARQIDQLTDEHRSRIRGDVDSARRHRKQAFARMADIIEEIGADLETLEGIRRELAALPGIDPTAPTIVIAGYPNVGKSSFLNAVTRARGETATYPFTTTDIDIGHVEHRHVTYQVIDTPGLLDRPAADRNAIERQTIAALVHLADCVLVMLDPSETCGYPLTDQLALRDELQTRFEAADVPVITVSNKRDLSTDVEADNYMSVTEGAGVEETLEAALDAIGYEPSLPFEAE